MKKLLGVFFALMLLLTGCGGGSGGGGGSSSSNPIQIGILPNGSSVEISSNNLPITISSPQKTTISLVGGSANESFVMNFTSSALANMDQVYKKANDTVTFSNGILVSPNSCILGTTGSGFSNSCEISVSVSADTLAGTYVITPTAVSSNMGSSTTLSPITVLVSGAVKPSMKTITEYSLNGTSGVITGHNIAVTMPYGTNVTALVATYITTGNSVLVGRVIQINGITPNNFTSPVIYTVTAADGSKQNYTVTVTVAQNTAKDILAYSLNGTTGVITGQNIAVTMPYGTNVTALVATYITTGNSVSVVGVTQINGVTSNNFTSPVIYAVTAADGSMQTYTVTVTVVQNTAKDILAYSLNGTTGVITGQNIAVTMPYGTNVTALVAAYITTGNSVSVDGVTQINGITSNNFTSPIVYTVNAADDSKQNYTVTVTVSMFSSPFGIVLNPTGTIVYITNFDGNTVSQCFVNGLSGVLSGCVNSGATGLDQPSGIALNSTGTTAYITNRNNNTVSQCSVSGLSGVLSGCVNSGATGLDQPAGITLNSTGTIAYITNRNNNTVSQCSVNGLSGVLSSCLNSGGTGLDKPTGITLNSTGTIAYVTKYSNNSISQCTVNSSSGALSGCADSGGTGLRQPSSIVFNATGAIAYITNRIDHTVSQCVVNSSSGALSGCVNSGGTGLHLPSGIVLNATGTTAYITNYSANSISQCSVNDSTGEFSGCIYNNN
ncbi:MAG: beta-propeller fold lactonase family protein [Amoebophilaceae bacterium]|nr:beta-propeller fold lactonase family protein [Amoebophilaceae bacterium]